MELACSPCERKTSDWKISRTNLLNSKTKILFRSNNYLDLTLLGQTKWDLPAYVTGTLLGSLSDVQR